MAETSVPEVFFANSIHNPKGAVVEIAESQIVDLVGRNSSPKMGKAERIQGFTPSKLKHLENGIQVSPAVLNSPALMSKQLTRKTSSFSVDVENMQLHMETNEKKSLCPATTDVVFFFAVILMISFVVAILTKFCIQ